jgi:hypothetical protein
VCDRPRDSRRHGKRAGCISPPASPISDIDTVPTGKRRRFAQFSAHSEQSVQLYTLVSDRGCAPFTLHPLPMATSLQSMPLICAENIARARQEPSILVHGARHTFCATSAGGRTEGELAMDGVHVEATLEYDDGTHSQHAGDHPSSPFSLAHRLPSVRTRPKTPSVPGAARPSARTPCLVMCVARVDLVGAPSPPSVKPIQLSDPCARRALPRRPRRDPHHPDPRGPRRVSGDVQRQAR